MISRKFKIIILLFLTLHLTLFTFHFCYADFEDFSVGARAMGMGGAFTGISDDASGLFYNPAGIVQLRRPEILGTGSYLFPGSADSFYGYIGFVYPVMKAGYFGINFLGRGVQARGKYQETTFGISYARSIDSYTSWGVTLKNCAQSNTDPLLPLFFKDRFPSGLSGDLGLIYKMPRNENLSIGIGIMDLGAGTWNFRTGAGYKFPQLFKIFQDSITLADFIIRGDSEFKLNLGVEGWFKPTPDLQKILKENLLGVRIGLKFGTGGDFSFALGAGIKSNNIEKTDWKVDCAIVPVYHSSTGFSGGSYWVSYSLLFGDAKKLEKDELAILAEEKLRREELEKLLEEKKRLEEENRILAEEKRKLEEEKKALEDARKRAMEDLKKLQGITIKEEKERIIIVATETAIHFASGSAEIDEKSYDTINKIAKALKSYPESIISIEGHTDNVPIGPKLKSIYNSNKELSQARAESVAQYFVNQGISPTRLVKNGYGESNPVALNTTADGRAKNRRVEIIIQK